MKCRIWKKSDYEVLKGWWDEWKFPAPPLEYLPPVGLIVESEEGPLAAGFLYKTDTPIMWIEWLVSNPKADKMVRGPAVDLCIDTLCFSASTLGAGIVFTSVGSHPLEHRLLKNGFTLGDKNVTQMFRRLP